MAKPTNTVGRLDISLLCAAESEAFTLVRDRAISTVDALRTGRHIPDADVCHQVVEPQIDRPGKKRRIP